ncbi:hypothetical protein KEM52_005826 [Ascosphaera acerosa]|nr:hypothetical protein KEM52_005826 [Ascosphaera acerosa]
MNPRPAQFTMALSRSCASLWFSPAPRGLTLASTTIIRPPSSTPLSLLRPPDRQCVRGLHKNVPAPPIPRPTPFVPDVATLLKLIGRNMTRYSSKLQSWNDFFTLSSEDLRALGIETARDRKYLLRWRDKFRRGEYGVGGDLDHVVDGVAELRAVQAARAPPKHAKGGLPPASLTESPGTRWVIINPPPGEATTTTAPTRLAAAAAKRYSQIRLYNGNRIKGPYLQTIKGTDNTAARLEVQEGMWEHKLGRKIDGGERKRAEVRAKKRAEERKKQAQ